MADSGVCAAASAAPKEPEYSSPTKIESSEEGDAPAAQVPPPDADLSGHQIAEPSSAGQNPDAQGSPGSSGADANLTQVYEFPYIQRILSSLPLRKSTTDRAWH
eukprot:8505234-Pyramimonas_sp.AAC.1